MLGVGKAVPRTLLTPASHPLLWCLLPPQESAEGTSGYKALRSHKTGDDCGFGDKLISLDHGKPFMLLEQKEINESHKKITFGHGGEELRNCLCT